MSRLQPTKLFFVAVAIFASSPTLMSAHDESVTGELVEYDPEKEEAELRAPKPDDLIAKVTTEDGKPISGLEVSVAIDRKYGFFSGAGDPPYSARTPSNKQGMLRFDKRLLVWRDHVVPELVEQGVVGKDEKVTNEHYRKFKGFTWSINGYWPKTTSRIEMTSIGKPSLWLDSDEVALAIPSLHPARIRAISKTDGRPLANVRLFLTPQYGTQSQETNWHTRGFAWTDVSGLAVLWLPKGDYQVHWTTTNAIWGVTGDINTAEDSAMEPGAFAKPKTPTYNIRDQARQQAFSSPKFFRLNDQPDLKVNDASPKLYELKLDPPSVILP